MRKLKERIKAAWAMLTQPHAWYACWSKSIDDEPVTVNIADTLIEILKKG